MYQFPFAKPPAPGEVVDVADGIKWLRLPLPYQLDHVNIYLIKDGDGWCLIDTGIGDSATKAQWRTLFDGALKGYKLTRLIVTHHHPDHIGLAGWLCAEHDIGLLISKTAYLSCQNIALKPSATSQAQFDQFYRAHGMGEGFVKSLREGAHAYLKKVTELPATYKRLLAGDELDFDGHRFKVLSGDGHAPEQLMLLGEKQKVLLCADQVIAKITPNVGVWAYEPDGNPLLHFVRSLQNLKTEVSDDVLLLPGHQLPFYGLHARVEDLIAHHEARCAQIYDACKKQSLTVCELLPVLFARELDSHQLGFAFREALAHINYMLALTQLEKQVQGDGMIRFAAH